MKPRLIEPVGESQTSEGDACYLRDTPDKGTKLTACRRVFPQQQRETCTTQTSTLLPTYDEVVNLTGLL
jgi:hypothetical protein